MTTNNTKTFKLRQYYIIYEKIFQKKSLVTGDFLIWFIGFVEGDGSFFYIKKSKQMVFSLTQKDSLILKEIQTQLKFGTIQASSTKRLFYLFCL